MFRIYSQMTAPSDKQALRFAQPLRFQRTRSLPECEKLHKLFFTKNLAAQVRAVRAKTPVRSVRNVR
jgi:hypothetical protein